MTTNNIINLQYPVAVLKGGTGLATTTINQLLYSSASNTIAGLATANNGTLVTSNTGVPSVLVGPGTTGNFLQSNNAAAPTWSVSTITLGGNFAMSGAFTFTGTVTGNTNVTFPTSGTLATTSQVMMNTAVAGITQTIASGAGYITANVALTTYTLPATAAVGDLFHVVGQGVGGWIIAQNANQFINFGSVVTTTGVGGSLASTNKNDSVRCLCITGGASTAWQVIGAVGELTYV